MKDRKILVVDDEEDIGVLMKMILKSAGFGVKHVSSIEQAKHALECEHFDTIFLDLNLNGQFGLYLLPFMEDKNSIDTVTCPDGGNIVFKARRKEIQK